MPLDHRTGFGSLFLAVGVVGLAGGVELIVKQIAQWRRSVRVLAKVLSVRAETTSDDNGVDTSHYLPTVSFAAGGTRVQTEVAWGSHRSKAFRKGQMLKVYYDPRDPKSAAIRRRDWPGGVAATILSGVCAAVGAALLWL
jgi:hypothetical protein